MDARAVQLGAEDVLEIAVKPEMIDDARGEHMRLAGGDEHAPSRLAERDQNMLDIGIDAVLEQPDVGKSLAIELEGAIGEALAAEQYRKARP